MNIYLNESYTEKEKNDLLREVAQELHEGDPYLKISYSFTEHA
jgi:hypothetical protein